MLITLLIVIPGLVMSLVLWFDSSLIFGDRGLTVETFWTFAGVAIGYCGFAFSLYAALMVRSISARYFTNQLLPIVAKKLEAAHKDVVDRRQHKTTEVRTDGFLEEITASLGSIDRMSISGIWMQKRRVRKHVRKLSKNISDERIPAKDLVEMRHYIELRQSLNGLHLELKNRIKEGKMR